MMAEDEFDLSLRADPGNLYYMAMDGTAAMDSAAFGALLERRKGWKNLLGHFLEPVPGEARLLDPAHPYLPIALVERDGAEIAVVCPGGRDSRGLDPFWQKYPGEDPTGLKTWPEGMVTTGRHTAAEESAELMPALLMNPIVEVVSGPDGVTRRIAADAPSEGLAQATRFAADLLYVSSHGWLGGFMGGNVLDPRPDAEPAAAREAYWPFHRYLVLGLAAKRGDGFHGPKWVILAQCSTMNRATWGLWARVLAASDPPVRGILAYEEASPAAHPSIAVATRFFDSLSRGESFVEAWKDANPGIRWAAIVHEQAAGDRLDGWSSFAPLGDVSTTARAGSYRGYLASAPRGEPIREAPAPFVCTLERMSGGSGAEVLPENLHDFWIARLEDGGVYRVTVGAPEGETLVSAAVKWIHIRPTHPHQFDVVKVFSEVTGGAVDPKDGARVQLTVEPGESAASAVFTAGSLGESGLEAHHSYLWIRAELTTAAGAKTHDFTTSGLSYYG
jgi:hypothetical protein